MTGLILHPLRLKALTEGRLSVLRVPFREQPKKEAALIDRELLDKKGIWQTWLRNPDGGIDQDFNAQYFKPPYAPGDYFVEEVWTTRDQIWDGDKPEAFMIPAIVDPSMIIYRINDPAVKRKWRNPLSMPEWAARYILTLGDPVPVRLGEVTEEMMIAEGVEDMGNGCGAVERNGGKSYSLIRAVYRQLWNTIYPRHPWSPDRWTWTYLVKWRRRYA